MGDAGFGVPVERLAAADAPRGVLAACCHWLAPASPPPRFMPECALSCAVAGSLWSRTRTERRVRAGLWAQGERGAAGGR